MTVSVLAPLVFLKFICHRHPQTAELTSSLKSSLSWGAENHPAGKNKKYPHILWTQEVNLPCSQVPAHGLVLRQLNSFNTITIRTEMHAFLIAHLRATCLDHLIFDHNNNIWWRVQNIKLIGNYLHYLIMLSLLNWSGLPTTSFSDIFGTCSPHRVRDQVLYP
jgi:hypothetical protein